MHDESRASEIAVWAAAEGTATPEQIATLEADPPRGGASSSSCSTTPRTTSTRSASSPGPNGTRWWPTSRSSSPCSRRPTTGWSPPTTRPARVLNAEPAGEVRLQASWSAGEIVVWAAGPNAEPEDNDALADRLEAIDGPRLGWSIHPDVPLGGGLKAAALSIPVADSLGWLVTVGGGGDRTGVGASVAWLGRVAVEAVRLVARGSVAPTLPGTKAQQGRSLDLGVKWMPALVDHTLLERLASAMPGPVTVVAGGDARAVTLDVLGAVVHAIVGMAARQTTLPAPPPTTRTTAAVAEAFMTRLDGSTFEAPVAAGAEVSKRLDRWASGVTGAVRSRLVVQLDPPDSGNAWFLSVLGPGADGTLLPIERALGDSKATKPLADALVRLERILPELQRPGELRRGQVYLSQAEAWELMTVTGEAVAAAGFDVRVPGAVAAQALARAAPVHRTLERHRRRGPPAQRRALVGGVRRRRAHRGRRGPARRRGPPARPVPRQVGRARRGRPEGGGRRARRALAGHQADRRRDPPPGRRPRGHGPGRRHLDRGLRLGQRAARAGAGGQDGGRPGTRGLRGRAAQLPGRGARLARVPRRGRARRLPRARHGPGQDAHRPRPRRPHRR